jgi:hypothetical protein
VKAQVSEEKEPYGPEDLNTVEEPTQVCQLTIVEGSERAIEKRLAKVDFGKLAKTNRPGWREFCREYDPNATITEVDTCNCYGFNQRC